ncbi:MAG TPA: F0F1 ATP synthase subunit gamma, partial [Myxococcaceae bacterium]|nr:F0F1 ATP synthase subunit gamma [Myxococcaceae bacterium]
MASLRDIRKRIRSVKSTQQITKAMKMVAAAKLRKAQDAILAARPYAQALDRLMAELAARSESVAHPLLERRPIRSAELLVLTSDRGLAGGFNANVTRRAARFLAEEAPGYGRVQVSTFGRKGNEFLRRRGVEIRKDHPGLLSKVTYGAASEVASELTGRFIRQEVDAVFILYNEFISAVSQQVTLMPLLPFQ